MCKMANLQCKYLFTYAQLYPITGFYVEAV